MVEYKSGGLFVLEAYKTGVCNHLLYSFLFYTQKHAYFCKYKTVERI